MRKNRAMRMASGLLVLTLLTTCMTAGTFAKYTTSATGNATARVAKFGVEVSVTPGNVFGKQYGAGGAVVEDTNAGITVKTSDNDMVVAPGTKGEMTFSITGTPETKVALKIALGDNAKEVMLAQGTYKDVTTVKETTATFNLAEAYYPVKWTLKKGDASSGTVVEQLENKKLSEINEYFNKKTTEYDGQGFADVAGTYTLSWAWDFDATQPGDNDKADTLLGRLAADSTLAAKQVTGGTGNTFAALVKDTDYCLEESFQLTISVTQVD